MREHSNVGRSVWLGVFEFPIQPVIFRQSFFAVRQAEDKQDLTLNGFGKLFNPRFYQVNSIQLGDRPKLFIKDADSNGQGLILIGFHTFKMLRQ